MEDILHCRICHEPYSLTERKPLLLPCGHTLCAYCLKLLSKSSQIKCPFDKRVHPGKQRQDIGPNHQILDHISQAKPIVFNPCPQHSQQPRFFCKQDQQPLCQLCLLDGHLAHPVVSMDSVSGCQRLKGLLSQQTLGLAEAKRKSKEIASDLTQGLLKFEENLKTTKKRLFSVIDEQFTLSLARFSSQNASEIKTLSSQNQELSRIQAELSQSQIELSPMTDELGPPGLLKLRDSIDRLSSQPDIPILNPNPKASMDENSIPLLSKPQKTLYLKAQNRFFEPLNAKLLRTLSDRYILQDPTLISALNIADRGIFVPPSEKTHCYEPYKPYKTTHGCLIPSPVVTVRLLENLLPVLQRNEARVLEVGCGTGYLTALFALLTGNRAKILSIEKNPAVLAQAKENLKPFEAEITNKIEFWLGEYRDFGLKAEGFDAIVLGEVLQGFPVEFKELLDRGGSLWTAVGSVFTKNVGCYVFERDAAGDVRSRKVEIPEEPSRMSFF